MKITKQTIQCISDTVERSVSVGASYNIVSSYGYAGIDWGTVKVLSVVPTDSVPKPVMSTYEDGGIDPEWLEEPWVQYMYTSGIGNYPIDTDNQYLPASLFIRHTVAP